jgi:hypothetical protein
MANFTRLTPATKAAAKVERQGRAPGHPKKELGARIQELGGVHGEPLIGGGEELGAPKMYSSY